MKRWNLTALPPSTEKQSPREAGADAPRVAKRGGQLPRVLYTSPACRLVVVELEGGETMGEHRVRERAIVYVTSGRVLIESSGEPVECDAGTLVVFEPSEGHSVAAIEDSQLLLVLAPWPAPEHYTGAEEERAQQLPANARVDPISARERP